jgi:hypothetical protein
MSAVRVERMQIAVTDGTPEMTWAQAHDPDPTLDYTLGFMKCRIDLNFIRQGKDIPLVAVAGKAPDRTGLLICSSDAPIKAGDRIVAIPNEYGETPIVGTFDIKAIPDQAIDWSGAHHLEVQIVETNQALAGLWPDDVDDEEGP